MTAAAVADEPIEAQSRPRSRIARVAARPERWFLAVAIVAGLGLAVALPPFGGYDESTHFPRLWQLTDGRVFAEVHAHEPPRAAGCPPVRAVVDHTTRSVGGRVPASLEPEITRLLFEAIPSPLPDRGYRATWHHIGDAAPHGPSCYLDFAQSAVYSPIVYLPAIPTVRVARWLGASLFVDVLVARLSLYASYVALVWFAIRRTTVMPWLFALAGLAPVALVQAMTLGADAMTYALTFVVVAEALRLADPRRVTRGAVVWATIAGCGLALTKPPYVLFVALLLVAAVRARGSTRRALIGAIVVPAIVAAAWSGYATSIYVPLQYQFVPGLSNAYHHLDSAAQLRRVVTRPWTLPRAIAGTIAFEGDRIARDTVTNAPSWLPPLWESVVVAVAIGVAAAVGRGRGRGRRERRWYGFVVASTLLVSLLLAYTSWNAYKSHRVDGYQGRYVYPLVVPLLIAVWPRSAPMWFARVFRRVRRTADGADRLLVAAATAEAVTLAAFLGGLAHFFA